MTWLMVVCGAAVGAPARYSLDRWISSMAASSRRLRDFPWGTFVVNAIACAILGLVTGLSSRFGVPVDVQRLLGPGLCGALSTYSTFSFETLRLAETGKGPLALSYAVVSIAVGLGVATAAYALGAHA